MNSFDFIPEQILGIDYGQKRIGLALAPVTFKLATPHQVIINRGEKAAISKIKEICLQEKVTKIIIGFPYSLAGVQKQKTVKASWPDQVKIFSQKLASQTNIPVIIEDERLSTKVVQALKKNLKIKEKNPQDAACAAVILQSYLDRN